MTGILNGMITNKAIPALAGTLILGNLLMPFSSMAETTITQDHQLINIQTRDEPLRTLLASLNKSSGIAFSYSAALGEQQLSAQVSAATWEDVLKKLLVEYSTAFIWDATGKLTHINLLRTAAPSNNIPVLAPLIPATSGPPENQYEYLDSGTPEAPPGATATISEPAPPADHLAGAGPPNDEPPGHPEEVTNPQGSMSGLFNALKIRKALPR